MYVPAPPRGSNGTTSLNQTTTFYDDWRRYETLAGALGQPDNNSVTSIKGSTTRRSMQSGIVGYKKYRNTPYSADYSAYTVKGKWIGATLSGSPKRYAGYRYSLYFGTRGGFANGIQADLTICSPDAANGNVLAVANRLAIANLTNRCKVECTIKAARQKIDLAETLSGLQQTVVMVATGMSQVIKAWQCARRGNWLAVFRHLGLEPRRLYGKTVSAKWLELQYGWLPFINDVYAGSQVIKEQLAPKDPAIQQFSVQDKGETELFAPTVSISPVWESSTTSVAGASVKVKYRLRVSDPFWAFMNSLQVLNPAYLVWVSLPFSFVLDWFMPIGSMLSALTSPIGLKLTSGYISTRSWCEVNVDGATRVDKSYVFSSGSAAAAAQAAFFRRIPLTAFPAVSLYFRFPFSSDQRLFSAMALLEQHRR